MAYLLGDYRRAGTLYARLMELAGAGSEDRHRARQGLFLSWYQTNQYARARELPPPGVEDGSSLLAFMQALEGEPYGIERANNDRSNRAGSAYDLKGS